MKARSGNLLHVLQAAREAAAPAIVVPGGATYDTRAWFALVGRLAAALSGLGIARGDRVSFKLAKCPEAVALAHACFQVGAIVQPINSSYTDAETQYMLEDGEPKLVVGDPAEDTRIARLARGARVESLGTGGSGTLGERAAVLEPSTAIADVPGDAAAAILYTSGTTGKPKGAQITHANLARSALALGEVWQLTPRDRLVHFLPVFHAHGLLTSLNVMLAAGASVHFLERFEPRDVMAALADATIVMGVPTHYGRLLREPGIETAFPAHFRLAISGSAPLPMELAREFAERTGQRLVERYGSTEAAIVTALPKGTEERAGWVGWPLPGVQVRVKRNDGTRVPREATGVLETRGHNVFRGYWRKPEADAEAFTQDGWFVTGDIAEIDASGCVRLLGRARDLIISGGLNIYPREVETAIDELPGIAESAVFGVPHPDFGEAGVAAVRLEPGADFEERHAIDALRTRLAPYKVPKRLLAVPELPRNGNGKVMKAQLRESYGALFASPHKN